MAAVDIVVLGIVVHDIPFVCMCIVDIMYIVEFVVYIVVFVVLAVGLMCCVMMGCVMMDVGCLVASILCSRYKYIFIVPLVF